MRPLLTLSLLLPCLSFAAEEPSYTGPDGCRFLNDRPQEYQRGTWSGACADGYASGSGVLQWYRGDQAVGGYQGQMERGQAQGSGEYFMNDGSTYKGGFKQGRRSGQGVLAFASGDILTGNFDGDGMIGDVDFTYSDGRHYHGSWNDGPNGAGTMQYPLGGSLTGNWHGPKPDGNFVINYPNGKQREASFPGNGGATPAAPLDQAYGNLTPEQRATIKKTYTILQEDDEPPYPAAGLWSIIKPASDVLRQLHLSAEISIDIVINTDGKAVSARILKSPQQDVSRYVVAELLKQKYKAAKCAGEPCEMAYPLRYVLSLP